MSNLKFNPALFIVQFIGTAWLVLGVLSHEISLADMFVHIVLVNIFICGAYILGKMDE